MQTSHSRRTYDYRIQEAICESRDRDLFPELEIPRSTLRSWIHRGVPDVVTCELALFAIALTCLLRFFDTNRGRLCSVGSLGS